MRMVQPVSRLRVVANAPICSSLLDTQFVHFTKVNHLLSNGPHTWSYAKFPAENLPALLV